MLDSTRRYEAVLMVNPALTEEALAQLQAQIQDLIGRAGGRTAEKFNLGKRRLSFKIGRLSEAVYLEIRFSIAPDQVAGLKKAVGLVENVIRFMIGRESTAAVPLPVTTGPTPLETTA